VTEYVTSLRAGAQVETFNPDGSPRVPAGQTPQQ
jgi:hypothetical protein